MDRIGHCNRKSRPRRWPWLGVECARRVFVSCALALLCVQGCASNSASVTEGSPKEAHSKGGGNIDGPAPRIDVTEHRITEVLGRGESKAYVVNLGTKEKANPTDIVFVYRRGKRIAKLRLTSVSAGSSVGVGLVGAIVTPPEVGDRVLLNEVRGIRVTGTILHVDARRGRVGISIRDKDALKLGERLLVYREQKKVGGLIVTQVQAWGSWCKVDGDTDIEWLTRGDLLESD